MKKQLNPNIFKITTIILLLTTIASSVFCIRLYFLNNDLKENADYTYNLYIEGITAEERKMYQEWIDNLDTDAYSAYNRGYKDGISEREENATDDNYSEAYDEGYNDAEKEHSELIENIIIFALISFIAFLFVINDKINRVLRQKRN